MIDLLYEDLKSHIPNHDFATRSMILGKPNAAIGRYLSTRQTIRLSVDETTKILDKINNQDINEGPYLKSLYTDIEYTENDNNLYANLEDAYDVSEYLSGYAMYMPKSRYFNYVCSHPDSVGVFNIYNGASANIPIDIIQSKISKDGREVIPGNYDFPKFSKIKYTEFTSTTYLPKNNINMYPSPFPVMYVNLPFAYYSKQYIPENIYTYDIDKKKYFFAGMDEETFNNYFTDICENGIRRLIFVQIRNGRIVSASNEDYLTILIASYLKLPTIPVVIYMINNTRENKYLKSERPSDVAVNYDRKVFDGTPRDMIDCINKVCENKLIYFNSEYHGDLKQYNTMINNQLMMLVKYMPDIDIINTPSDEITYVDFYLKHEPVEVTGIPVSDIESNNKRVAELAKEELNALIDEKIERLNQMIENS